MLLKRGFLNSNLQDCFLFLHVLWIDPTGYFGRFISLNLLFSLFIYMSFCGLLSIIVCRKMMSAKFTVFPVWQFWFTRSSISKKSDVSREKNRFQNLTLDILYRHINHWFHGAGRIQHFRTSFKDRGRQCFLEHILYTKPSKDESTNI